MALSNPPQCVNVIYGTALFSSPFSEAGPENADPDIPILKEAKAEYAKLQCSLWGLLRFRVVCRASCIELASAKFDSPAVESRSRQPATPLLTRSDSF